ncbi:TonB-dependent receptor [uncultured Arcobacter sp.]|uniref:TonB-dependent receptor n=1 Tax=uncultured Arcobacter sp. TaxID=165434 RepID=UPI00262AD8C9|nr:TonB-dependent receptor [uncultured Arcobacter sp.]
MKLGYSLIALGTIFATCHAETIVLDKLSVTATKIERATKDVTQSIDVVDEKDIEDKNIIFASEAINSIPGVIAENTSNSSSPRLIIRGAGLKSRYGVREIMVIKDGVPMTDPDSFTRFDYIDMQDVKAVEVQKGPGSIAAANATGGVVQLITKSVFEENQNRIKLGFGTEHSSQSNIKFAKALDENNFMSFNFSTTKNDNDWRKNNKVDSLQFGIKYGHIFDDESILESELAYTESNVDLPASMTESEFNIFKSTGKQGDTSSAWQHSSRDSKILFFNSKLEKEFGNLIMKPRFYINSWEHFHPVTAMINDSDDNVVLGADLENNYSHKLFEEDATLVFGVTAKQDRTRESKKYTYKDYSVTGPTVGAFATRDYTISSTLSNEKGDLANVEDSTSTLYGAYIQESFKPTTNTLVDVSLRVDRVSFDVDGNEILKYNWGGSAFTSANTYYTGGGLYSINESYTLVSPKIGISYALSDTHSIYSSVASANQAPTDNELKANKTNNKGTLDKTTSVNYEIGLKARDVKYSYDIALYQNDISDEVTATKDGFLTYYQNAGKTQKRGLEFTGSYNLTSELSLGASYAYSYYKFISFMEEGTNDRANNYLPYIPQHRYSLFATLNLNNGFKARIETKSSGSYYMDNANTEKYSGYDFVTDIMMGYSKKNHTIQLNINNLFDKHYAAEVQKDTSGVKTYKAAAPISAMITYNYKF